LVLTFVLTFLGPILRRVLEIYGTAQFVVKKAQDGHGYETKSPQYFCASPEDVTSHFMPILFARNRVVEIIQHSGGWLEGNILERNNTLMLPSAAQIDILQKCYRQWRKFHEDTYASTYASNKQNPKEFKERMLALRKTPLSTDEGARQPLAWSPEGSRDSDSTNSEGPICDVCHLPDHESLCPWTK
jgi:hypothetical protein